MVVGSSEPAPVPRRVWGGTVLLVLGRVWGSACTLATLALLARHLDGPDFGRFTFYLAVFLVLDSLVDLGTGQAAIQLSAADPARTNGVIAAARRVRLGSGLVGVVLVGGGAWLAGEPGAGWILLASFYPVTHVLELSTLVFKNQIQWSRPVAVRALASGLSLAFVLAVLRTGSGEPAHYLVAVAGGSTLGNVMLHLVGRLHLPARGGPRVPLKELLILALPMGGAGVCQQAYFWIDNLFVRALEGDAPLGRYNLAVRVMSFGIMAAVYASLAALPWLTREQRAGRLGAAVVRLSQPTLALACLGAGLVWSSAEDLLVLLGGEPHFAAAGPALRWLLLAAVAVYAGAPLLTGVVAAGRGRSVLVISVVALVVNLVGNSLLVPTRGIEGAAIATLVTEAVVMLGAGLVLTRAGSAPSLRPWGWTAGPALFILGRLVAGWFGF
jgi:O-antigen/teichoic acid export membrane protein